MLSRLCAPTKIRQLHLRGGFHRLGLIRTRLITEGDGKPIPDAVGELLSLINGYSYAGGNPVNDAVGELIFHNGYSYANGNPVNLVDPSGMFAETPAKWDKCYSLRYRQSTVGLTCDPQQRSTGECACREQCAAYSYDEIHIWGLVMPYVVTTPNTELVLGCMSECLTSCASPNTGCRIEVTSKPVLPGLHHSLVVFTDRSLQEFVYQGGPEFHLGEVVVLPLGAYGEVMASGPTSWADIEDKRVRGYPRQILISGEEACAKQQCLNDEVARINNLSVTYYPAEINSNTVIRTMLMRCGLADDVAEHFLPTVPGWANSALE